MPPHVIAKTYLFEHPISALSTTSTRYGITSRDLLIATSNQLISLPKRLLDPRRPVIPQNGKVRGDEKEEGLVAYDPLIPDERKWAISHINEVPLIPQFLELMISFSGLYILLLVLHCWNQRHLSLDLVWIYFLQKLLLVEVLMF